MELIIASHNENKILEFKKKLGKNFFLKSLSDIGFKDDIPENENTIEKNAIFKSNFIYKKYNCNVLSDDTGLEIEALNNEPGVRSARYSGEEKNSLKNIKLVLKKLKGISNRNARFKTVIFFKSADEFINDKPIKESFWVDPGWGSITIFSSIELLLFSYFIAVDWE